MKNRNMAVKTYYVCRECGHRSSTWLGKCPECGAWNSFDKFSEDPKKSALARRNTSTPGNPNAKGVGSRAATIQEILDNSANQETHRLYPFSASPLNQFWGGGISSSSLTLLAGEPGIGKSTLALQVLRALHTANSGIKLMYITAEEAVVELARRSQRLNIPTNIICTQCNLFEDIETLLTNEKPNLVIIDSIQTVYSNMLNSAPGSINQVSTLTNHFLSIAKSENIAIILIGHVTKEGQIAGPKTLEHMVDSVLLLEAEESTAYRTLYFSKHRFGSTDNLILMEMEETGLNIITDPSLALLENLESGIGVCYGMAVDKNTPFVVEVQCLVSDKSKENGYGRRETLGIKTAKLNAILAIMEKYLRIELTDRDVYLQVSGMPKNTQDDSLDLPILLGILSSLYQKSISQLMGLIDKTTASDDPKNQAVIKQVFAGRLTFSGNLRAPTSPEMRQRTAEKLGFGFNTSIKTGYNLLSGLSFLHAQGQNQKK
jgi:DNA repair protein RadA/Sms